MLEGNANQRQLAFFELSPDELILLATSTALGFSKVLNVDEINVLGNFFSAVGQLLSTIAAQKQALETQQEKSEDDNNQLQDVQQQIKQLQEKIEQIINTLIQP